MSLQYPITKKENYQDDYFGKIISDPYQWLEDDHSRKTKDWVERQNKVTFDYLNNIKNRDKIKNRLKEIWKYEKYSTPKNVKGLYYFWKNDGLQNQPVLYRQHAKNDKIEVVLDPAMLSNDGTASISEISFSKDGRYMIYAISQGGSDWNTIKVLDLSTLQDLSDELKWVKSLSWIKNYRISWYNDGFFYSRYPEPTSDEELTGKNNFHAVYYHRLGEDQDKDQLVYMDKQNPDRYAIGLVSDDQKYFLLLTKQSTSGQAVAIASLDNSKDISNLDFVTVYEGFEYEIDYVGSLNNDLLFHTNYNAPLGRLISLSMDNASLKNATEIIPQTDNVLMDVVLAGKYFVCHYLEDVKSKLYKHDQKGNLIAEIEIAKIGSVVGLTGDINSDDLFFGFNSFTHPTTIYRYELISNSLECWKSPELTFDTDQFETQQIFYKSKDGTKVPMFIIAKKGLQLDGSSPCLVYGYGGFDISLTPFFSPAKIAFLEMGGIYCVANIRGGGEYGKDWYDGGIKMNKQNVFDDFIAACQFLIKNDYTTSSKLIIEGGSNGGLLVGACLTQKPDLFAVCLPRVGVLDMLKYHKFTVGWGWAGDYGTSEDSLEMFDYLLNYSPLHNCRKGNYPATLITTADHDDRVVPAHSFKFAATLQESQLANNPVLIRIDTNSGHGAGKSTEKSIDEAADLLAFALSNIS
jgi:prolyl oligopeptidase